jgi:Protein of unknown function (DUF559)
MVSLLGAWTPGESMAMDEPERQIVPSTDRPESASTSEPSAALDRHQSRRDSGLPTVSVLAGPWKLVLREARLWADRRGRPIVEVADPRLDAMADAWADRLAAVDDLRRRVVARLARRLGDDADDLGGRIARMSRPELELFLEEALPDRDGEGVEAACRWILQGTADGMHLAGPGLASRLGSALSSPAGLEPTGRALDALGALIAPGSGPVILASRAPDDAEAPAWFEAAARSMARLALAQPRLSAILLVDPAVLDAYLRVAPESREKALIRSGVVAVGDEIGRRPVGSEPDGPVVDDRARSEAERFLFERLESLPATAGLFELNSALDIPFGPGRSMEVDLASDALQLAIEVDGYYHFQDEEAYRRDRRKDFLLQSRGYLVVRVLAEDVVRRLEDVLALILEAVASRRGDPNDTNRDTLP